MAAAIESERLELRPWSPSDAPEALSVYGTPTVTQWLPLETPPDSPEAMRSLLAAWQGQDAESPPDIGHWSVRTRADQELVGGLSLQHTPPGGESIALVWALAPGAWGHGYAAEAGEALVRWAMHEQGVIEVFAVVQPDNVRAAATAKRIGMEWVTELGHLSQGRYQVFRIRHSDLAYRD
jgi:RimJ/RimL family protein N-acetyltransferase